MFHLVISSAEITVLQLGISAAQDDDRTSKILKTCTYKICHPLSYICNPLP